MKPLEIKQLYARINATDRPLPEPAWLHQMIAQQALANPNRIAVVCEDQQMTYGQLNQLSDELAARLIADGVQSGDLVGLCCLRQLEMPVYLLGILKSGAAYVPLDPDYPLARLREMAEEAGLRCVVANRPLQWIAQQLNAPTLLVDSFSIDERPHNTTLPAEVARRCDQRSADQSPAYVIYTSGSTGRPKGVVITHQSVTNLLASMVREPGFSMEDRILATTTLSFDISVVEIFLPLVTGGSVAVVDRAIAKDSHRLKQAIDRYQVTVIQATPAMWRTILDDDFEGGSHLRFFTGGEPLARDLLQKMLAHCGEVWNMYGPTEATVYASIMRFTAPNQRILIGRPVDNTKLVVVDPQLNLCPPETPGELLIGGRQLALEYLNRSELTAEKFIQYNGQRFYRTGDLAQITEDGWIGHLGRIDSQIKLHGHRIELGEIETALADQPSVRQAAVVLREDTPGDGRLVGYVLVQAGQTFEWQAVRQQLKQRLPDYMIPSMVVSVDQFYYTPSGKLDRTAFPPPQSDRSSLPTEFVPPRSEPERKIAEIWQSILKVQPVGVDDNFFELGGNSIRATALLKRLKIECDLELSAARFFDQPTIRAILTNGQTTTPIASREKTIPSNQQTNGFAIVGMGARFPGAQNLQQYWQNLINVVESIQFFKPEELDPSLDPTETSNPNYVAARGIIEDADSFDAGFFAEPPKSAALIDPQQRVMLEVAYHALEDAGIRLDKQPGKIGVWAGNYSTTYHFKNLLANAEVLAENGEFALGVANEKDYIATRIAFKLNLTGPAINVNTACSTSLIAVIQACNALAQGQCDVALAGGCSIHFPQHSGHVYQSGSIFTPDGHCRPFDADGAGTLFSDGAGMVVLKRLNDAIADQDRIYGVIKGLGINNDGLQKASFSAPSITGQAAAVTMALQQANFHPETLGYIEAHGTATPVGDPIEVTALKTVYENQTDKKQFCAIGSVKSNIGHTVAAAGIAGLIKTAMALHQQVIPATLHFKRPFPTIDFENSPFFVCDKNRPWLTQRNGDYPRRAGVSSFGVGGTNAHVVLEEFIPPSLGQNHPSGSQSDFQFDSNPAVDLSFHLWPISAKSEQALQQQQQQLAHFCDTTDQSIEDIAYTLQNGRTDFAWRCVAIGSSLQQMQQSLSRANPHRLIQRRAFGATPPVVFLFPGQGAQYLNMGRSLYETSSFYRDLFDECCEILKPFLQTDLRNILFVDRQNLNSESEFDQEALRATRFTQPALFSIGYCLGQLYQHWGVQPTAMVGHSIGEFAAACLAGVFSLSDGLELIAKRGELMQALPAGSMMSVRLPGSEVEPLIDGQLAIAAYNGPNLCVVAGPDDEVSQLQQQLEAQGVVCRQLHTSHAFHSPMMDSIVDPFFESVSSKILQTPRLPILSTVTGRWLTEDQATDPRYWAEHLRKPVRFSTAVSRLWEESPDSVMLELGPRRTLATLAKQVAAKSQVTIESLGEGTDLLTELHSVLSSVAKLWTCGVSIDWKQLCPDPHQERKKISLPSYPFQRKRYFIDPPSSKPPQPVSPSQTVHSDIQSTNFTPLFTASKQPPKKKMSRKSIINKDVREIIEQTSGFEMHQQDDQTTFFEIGLDSLLLTQTAKALSNRFETEVSFRQLMEGTPSLGSLTDWLDERLPTCQFSDTLSAGEIEIEEVEVEEPTANRSQGGHQAGVQAERIAPCIGVDHNFTDDTSGGTEPIINSPGSATEISEPIIPPSSTAIPQDTAVGHINQAVVMEQIQLMRLQLQLLGLSNGTDQKQGIASGMAINTSPQDGRSLSPAAVPQPSDAVANQNRPNPLTDPFDPPEPSDPVCKSEESKNEAEASIATDQPSSSASKPFGAAARVSLTENDLSSDQRHAIAQFCRDYAAAMPNSKRQAQLHRPYLADPRTVSGFRPSFKEMTFPIVVQRSKGVHLWDIDGNQYVDLTCGFGSNFLGHGPDFMIEAMTQQLNTDYSIGPQTALAGEVAQLFCELTGSERVAFANTGSEAVLAATRLARARTGKDKIVIFQGAYHGILDEVIVRGNSRLKSFPAATGIPAAHVSNTLILEYGDPASLEIIQNRIHDLAAILVEPVQSRRPELQPREFIQQLASITKGKPTALIMDEVISGLRIGPGGAQQHFGVKADLATYGKVVGGGLPIGVVAGKAEYMDGLDGGFWQFGDDSRPEVGMTYFAGTFCRHPLALAAAKRILQYIQTEGQPMYDRLNGLADSMAKRLNELFQEFGVPMFLAQFGSLFKVQFQQETPFSELIFAHLRRRGYFIWDHRPCLLTVQHTQQHIDGFVAAFRETIIELKRQGLLGDPTDKIVENQTFENPSAPALGKLAQNLLPKLDAETASSQGARLGKDRSGTPTWFISDPINPGRYLPIGTPSMISATDY